MSSDSSGGFCRGAERFLSLGETMAGEGFGWTVDAEGASGALVPDRDAWQMKSGEALASFFIPAIRPSTASDEQRVNRAGRSRMTAEQVNSGKRR